MQSEFDYDMFETLDMRSPGTALKSLNWTMVCLKQILNFITGLIRTFVGLKLKLTDSV